jgi:hypothetical protein
VDGRCWTTGNEKFYAIENFYYTTEFFGTDKSPTFLTDLVLFASSLLLFFLGVCSIQSYRLFTQYGHVGCIVQVKAGETYCQQEFKQLTGKYPKVSHDELGKYCFSISFMDELLRKGLGFSDPEKNVQIMVCVQLNQIKHSAYACLHPHLQYTGD